MERIKVKDVKDEYSYLIINYKGWKHERYSSEYHDGTILDFWKVSKGEETIEIIFELSHEYIKKLSDLAKNF